MIGSPGHEATVSAATPEVALPPTKPLDWDTLLDQANSLGRVGGWAPGSYMGRCLTCERLFEGDKRATSCLPCGVANLQRIVAKATDGPGLHRVFAGFITEQSEGEWTDEMIAADVEKLTLAYRDHLSSDGAGNGTASGSDGSLQARDEPIRQAAEKAREAESE